MPSWGVWGAIGVGAAVIAALAYWHLVLAEGAYLGQRVVTWLYDLTAPRYDAIKQYNPLFEALFLGQPLAECLADVPQPLVLDIGTGTGRLPLALFAQEGFRGCVVGVDHSQRMLEIAARKTQDHADRLLLLRCDAAHLPFADAAFDAVTCLEMLEFTPSPADQLTEAVRVLRPGGVLLTTRRRGLIAWLMPGKALRADTLRALLHRLGMMDVEIQRWQVEYDLVWGFKAGHSQAGGREPLEALHCPHCRASAWDVSEEALRCRECNCTFPFREGIVQMI